MSRRYQCVIFDWDGTLIDSEKKIVHSIQYAAAQVGLPVLSYDASKRIIGLSLEKAILGLYPNATPEQVTMMSSHYTKHFLEESDVMMAPFEGMETLLLALKTAGVKLAVATGKSRKGLDQVSSQLAVGHFFDLTRTPVESASKPDPLMLVQILEAFDLSVDQAVMVGDTEFDLLMAQNLGMDAIAMSHGVHDVSHLRQFSPVAECDDLFELKEWLLPRVCHFSGK